MKKQGGLWGIEQVIISLVSYFGEGYREEIEGSLDLSGGAFDNWGSFIVDGKEWSIIQDESTADRIAEIYVADMLDDEPTIFVQDWLRMFVYITDIDQRIIADEEAMSYIGEMDEMELINYMGLSFEDDAFYEEIMELERNLEALDGSESVDAIKAQIELVEKRREEWLEQIRDLGIENYYDTVLNGLSDPINYFVDELGIYSIESLLAQPFISIDVNKAAKDAVYTDGWAHFLSLENGDYLEIDDGYVIFEG